MRRLNLVQLQTRLCERKIIVFSLFFQGRSPRQSHALPLRRGLLASANSFALTAQILLVTLVMGLVSTAAVMGWRFQRVHANQVWLDQCHAEYEWHYQVPHVYRPMWQRLQKDIATVMGPASVSDFHTIRLAGAIEDSSLAGITSLRNVLKLSLESDAATDKTIGNISQLRQLRSLTLAGKQFSFEGLLELRRLPNLRHLNLRNMSLSMAELAVLETAVPQANLKYCQSDSGRTYERQVVARYPRMEKKVEEIQTGFAPLLGQAPVESPTSPAGESTM